MTKHPALCLALVLALAMSCLVHAEAPPKEQPSEQTTESPIADMALIGRQHKSRLTESVRAAN